MKKLFIPVAIIVCATLTYSLYPAEKLPAGAAVDSIVVYKVQRQMQVFAKGQLLATYKVALGHNPQGAKQYEGDGKTPEGSYRIDSKTTESRYHTNLGISYPNAADRLNAARLGRPPGGNIKIHGLQNGLGFIGRLQHLRDWTAGCIALTNAQVDDLYEHTPVGAAVTILP